MSEHLPKEFPILFDCY